DAGGSAAGRLLLCIHHWAVDGVSWRILVPDVAAAWAALAGGAVPALGQRSTSVRRWAHWLAAEAREARRLGELSFWRGMLSAPSVALVEGCLDRARDVAGRAGQLTLTLPGAVTGPLLTRVPAAFHGGINDVLLTALVVAIADWSRRRGGATSRAVVIDLEGHGREEPSAGVGVLGAGGGGDSRGPGGRAVRGGGVSGGEAGGGGRGGGDPALDEEAG